MADTEKLRLATSNAVGVIAFRPDLAPGAGARTNRCW